MFAGILGAGYSTPGHDPNEERDPPPRPTPLTFPPDVQLKNTYWTEESRPHNHQALFSKLVRPTDLRDEHAESLNIVFTNAAAAAADLLPEEFLPRFEQTTDVPHSYAAAAKPDAGAKKRKEYLDRAAELQVSNDEAFAVLNGRSRTPRLAYMRKFWDGLNGLADFWDCSLDNYYNDTVEGLANGENSAKRQKLDTPSPSTTSTPSDSGPSPPSALPPLPDSDPDEQSVDGDSDQMLASRLPLPGETRLRYKGRRTSTGRDMPDEFRSNTIQRFIEGVVWPFQASVAPPRVMPRVQFGKLSLPVRQTAAVYRIPNDRAKTRAGYLEGPIFGIQSRPETDFNKSDPREQSATVRLDTIREIGALLQIAQERKREGKLDIKPGAGAWWTEKVRWGGGPEREYEPEPETEAEKKIKTQRLSQVSESAAKIIRKGTERIRQMTPNQIEMWKELKCGRGYWDPKTSYVAIGKDVESPYDEVFLVSSLNHHISIVKMTVHAAYLDYLESAILPTPLPEDPEWCRPTISRTRWFDLFEKDDRLEAFRLLWGVMEYLTRAPSKPVPEGSSANQQG